MNEYHCPNCKEQIKLTGQGKLNNTEVLFFNCENRVCYIETIYIFFEEVNSNG